MPPRHPVLAFRLTILDMSIVGVAFKFSIRVQSIGANGAPQLDGIGDEAVETRSCQIGDTSHTDPPDSIAVPFDRDDDECLPHRLSPNNPFFFASPIGLVDLDGSLQTITAGSHHRAAKLVQ